MCKNLQDIYAFQHVLYVSYFHNENKLIKLGDTFYKRAKLD